MTAPTLYVRRARREDIDTIYEWRHETAVWLAKTHGTDQWSVPYPRSIIENWVDRGETFMAALEPDGQAIATITSSSEGDPKLWTPDELARPARYVSKANVVRAQANRDIGATLFAWARHLASEAGAEVMRIDVWSTNEKLQDLYRRRGFRYLRTVPGTNSGALFEMPSARHPGLPVIELFEQVASVPAPEVDQLAAQPLVFNSIGSGKTNAIAALAAALIRIPSRAERDEREPILRHLQDWLHDRDVPLKVLTDPNGHRVAGLATIDSGEPGPAVALNACADTAGFGDEGLWTHPPTGAEIEEGWLYGRGAADSKTAAAMFAHLAVELAATPPPAGQLLVLFDVDEHSGRFGGAKAFQKVAPPLTAMMIGYPGNHGVVVGARGFWRATITTLGKAAHSGSTSGSRENAISKAARLIVALENAELPGDGGPGFPFGPSLTVTSVHGGEGYSQVPDRCDVKVDVRLTPTFRAEEARALVFDVVAKVDAGTRLPSTIDVEDSWPAYRLADNEPVVAALRRAAARHLGRDVPAVTCGPSNIGNFFGAHGIPATCGFGVTYRNIHAVDEAIELASIEAVYLSYRDAVLDLLAGRFRKRVGPDLVLRDETGRTVIVEAKQKPTQDLPVDPLG